MQMKILKGREKSVAVTQEMHSTFCSIQFYNAIFTKSSKELIQKFSSGGSHAIKNMVKAKEKHIRKQLLQLFICGTF